MFTTLWAKLVAGMGAIIVIMATMLKFKSHKIDNLEQENEAHEKEDELIEEMKEAEIEVEAKKNEAIENINTDNWRDNI